MESDREAARRQYDPGIGDRALVRSLPPLPGVDPSTAPRADDPAFSAWVQRVGFPPEGVDRRQIWEMLHSTPAERLAAIEALWREIKICAELDATCKDPAGRRSVLDLTTIRAGFREESGAPPARRQR